MNENIEIIRQILERIDKILNDKKHIEEAFNLLSSNNQPQGDTAVALSDIVREREETNRKILDILEKQLDNLTR